MPRSAAYRSAFAGALTTPSVAQILAFHKAHFGDARMGPDDPPAGDPPKADPPKPDPPKADPPAEGDRGFPADTPIAEMTVAQQAAYWKHQARKHETTSKSRQDYDEIKAERDRLKSATQTDTDRAIEAAKNEGRTEAQRAASERLVAAEFRVAFGGRKKADEVKTLLEPLDLSKFLASDGEVDTDKVQKYVDGIAPAGSRWPDTGAGRRGDAVGRTKREAGIAEAQRRFGKTPSV